MSGTTIEQIRMESPEMEALQPLLEESRRLANQVLENFFSTNAEKKLKNTTLQDLHSLKGNILVNITATIDKIDQKTLSYPEIPSKPNEEYTDIEKKIIELRARKEQLSILANDLIQGNYTSIAGGKNQIAAAQEVENPDGGSVSQIVEQAPQGGEQLSQSAAPVSQSEAQAQSSDSQEIVNPTGSIPSNTIEQTSPSVEQSDQNAEQLSSSEQREENMVSMIENLSFLFSTIDVESLNGQPLVLNQQQLDAIDRINSLRMPAMKVEMFDDPTIVDILNDDSLSHEQRMDAIKKERKRLGKATKEIEKEIRSLERFNETYQKYANKKNQLNYQKGVATGVFRLARNFLDKGVYFDESLTFAPPNTKLIVDLCSTRAQYRNQPTFILPYNTGRLEVVNGPLVQVYGEGNREYFGSYGGVAPLVQWISDKTKMDVGQANNMINTLGMVGTIGGIFLLGRWLFTEKGADGKRKFSLSFGRFATLIGVPLATNWISQMTTGKGALENIETAWRTGKFPWSRDSLERASASERVATGMSTVEFALMGVPYRVLAECCESSEGIVSSVNLEKLIQYYEQQIALHQEGTREYGTLKTQLEAVKSLQGDEASKRLFNTIVSGMDIDASDFEDPQKANENLNEKMHQNAERFKQLESYINSHKLIINPNKESELSQVLYNKNKNFSDAELQELVQKDILTPNDETAQELAKLPISDGDRKSLYKAFSKFSEKADFKNIKLEVVNNQIKLSGNGKELFINPIGKTLPDFKKANEELISFDSFEELLRMGLFINALRSEQGVRNIEPDQVRSVDENWPFDLSSGWQQIPQGLQSIIFKQHGGEKVIIENRFPFISQMDLYFPTIERRENRHFFVNYLNRLRDAEHSS